MCLIKKIFVYYRQLELARYLIRRHNDLTLVNDNDFNNLFFFALSELLLHAIRVRQQKISKELSDFMHQAFKLVRDRHPNEAINYPVSYYEFNYAAIEELSIIRSPQFSYLQERTGGSLWLLGDFVDTTISPLTFSWMWHDNILSLENDREDFVFMHWRNAHQHYSTQLMMIPEEYNSDFTVSNKLQVDKRGKERKDFFYFHTILGALVFYFRKLETLKKIFQYTQSIPPEYVLLPRTMEDIFHFYFKLSNNFDPDFNLVDTKYPFPGFDGLNAGAMIKDQINNYLALLFLRQYSIAPRFVGQDALRLPSLPATQGEKISWRQRLPNFMTKVRECLADGNVLRVLSLDFITDEHCIGNNIKPPIELLKKFSEELKESFESTEVSQEIDTEKRQKFLDTTKVMMLKTFDRYNLLQNVHMPTEGVSSNYINGMVSLLDKSAFSTGQGFDNLNFHSIMAESLSDKIKRGISESFYLHKSEQYLVKDIDKEKFLDKLHIKDKGMVIVKFGHVVLDYPGVESISLQATNPEIVGNCIFVLRKYDLPSLHYNETNENYKKDYELETLDIIHFLYASVVDLNLRADLRQEIQSDAITGDLTKKVLANICINMEIKWKSGIKCVALKIVSPFREEGIVNELNDMKPF
jgi:hypothetical protein